MSQYGSVYRVSDFIERLVPKRGQGKFDGLFVHRAIAFLKFLDGQQEANPAVTLSTHVGDAVWVLYEGLKLCFILPGKDFVRIGVLLDVSDQGRALVKILNKAEKAGDGVVSTGEEYDHVKQWRVGADGLHVVEDFLAALPQGFANSLDDVTHPRHIPGPARQAAFERFERSGRVCPGARGVKKHKLAKNDPVEFDHILPHAKGGASSIMNVQVLCVRCNRAKGATAL
jgi:hypothetical protein